MPYAFSLFKRFYHKLRREFILRIPNNIYYKPDGIHPTIQLYAGTANAESREVYPAQESRLEVPDTLLKLCQKYKHQFVPKSGLLAAASVTAVNHGRICTDGVNYAAIVADDNKLIGEISLQVGSTVPSENGIFKQNYFDSPLKLTGIAFHTLIGGSGENNYFHWLFDSLPRIHLLKESGWFDKVDWFIVPCQKLHYQKDTLQMLGIKKKQIIEGHNINHIQAEKLLASTFVRNIEHIPMWACSFLRDSFLPMANKLTIYPKRIYISRQDSSSRTIINERETTSLLRKYGFEKIILSNLSFAEQVGLFASAEFIIAPHGAGLANLVFCKEGTQIIELFAKEYTLPLYADLAHKVNLDYDYMLSYTYPVARSLRNAMQKSIKVNVVELEQLIKKKLSLPEIELAEVALK